MPEVWVVGVLGQVVEWLKFCYFAIGVQLPVGTGFCRGGLFERA